MKYLVSYTRVLNCNTYIHNEYVDWEDGITKNNITAFEHEIYKKHNFIYDSIPQVIAITKLDEINNYEKEY